MKLHGHFVFNAPQTTVWELLLDTNKIAAAMPWVESFAPLEGEMMAWQATAQVAFYSNQDTYHGTVHLVDITPPHQYLVKMYGSGDHANIRSEVLIRLKFDEGKQRTILRWNGEVVLPQKMADLKPEMIQLGANMMSMVFFSRLAKNLPMLGTA